jgi:hypothetical protein
MSRWLVQGIVGFIPALKREAFSSILHNCCRWGSSLRSAGGGEDLRKPPGARPTGRRSCSASGLRGLRLPWFAPEALTSGTASRRSPRFRRRLRASLTSFASVGAVVRKSEIFVITRRPPSRMTSPRARGTESPDACRVREGSTARPLPIPPGCVSGASATQGLSVTAGVGFARGAPVLPLSTIDALDGESPVGGASIAWVARQRRSGDAVGQPPFRTVSVVLL